MKDLALVMLMLAALAFLAVGFIANTTRYEQNMRSPGAYWTVAMTCFLPITLAAGVPPLVLTFNFIILAATVVFWAVDANRGAKQS